MRKLVFFLVLALSCASNPVSGEIISLVTSMDTNLTNLNSSSGTIALTNDNILSGTHPGSISFEVTGLTIDGVGAADDSFQFTFALTGTNATSHGGGTPSGFGQTSAGGIGVNSTDTTDDSASQIDLDGESIAFSLQSASVTLGAGATEVGQISFVGFTGFDLTSFGSDDRYNLTGTSADGTGLSTDPQSFDGTSAFTIAFNSNSGLNNGFRIRDVNASFDVSSTVAVPEPSTILMFSVLGLAGFRRRRAA